MSGRAAWRRLVDQLAAEYGCAVKMTGASHLRLKHPSGWIVITSQTPSDKRAVRNLVAELRRHARRTA